MSADTNDVTEDSLFDQAIDPPTSDAAPEPAPAADPAAKPAVDPSKPDQSAAPEPKADTVVDTKSVDADGKPKVDDDAPMVPSWRVREITADRHKAEAERDAVKRERDQLAFEQQEFRRRLAALEKPAAETEEQEPDPLLDPKGYREHMERRFEARLANERRELSLQNARKVYKEEFDQAYEAAKQLVDPGLRARMQQSSDPGETLIGWFRELKMRVEIGNDPAAYRKKISDDLLKDPEYRKRAMEAWRAEAQVNQQTNGRPLLAPSLNGVSRSSAALRASQQDLSDEALWDTTTT